MKKKTITEIDWRELEKLVQSKLGFKEYNFIAVEECGNDSEHSFDVDGELDEFDTEDIEKWKKGEFVSYSNPAILNYLCKKKFIKKGEYLVTVCW